MGGIESQMDNVNAGQNTHAPRSPCPTRSVHLYEGFAYFSDAENGCRRRYGSRPGAARSTIGGASPLGLLTVGVVNGERRGVANRSHVLSVDD